MSRTTDTTDTTESMNPAMPCPQKPGSKTPASIRRAVVLSAALVFLASCEGAPLFEDQPAEPPEAAAEKQVAPRPEELAAAVDAKAQAAAAEAEVQVTALPPEPVMDDDPEQLVGMGPATLSAFLGAPQLIRREFPASLWQYQVGGCVLDVVFYPEKGADKVSYVEARENGLDIMPARDCLNRLIRKRRGLPLG